MGAWLVHVSDMVLLLGLWIVLSLFVGLIYLGRECYRLTEQNADGHRLKDLIHLENCSQEMEMAAERLWKRLAEDDEQLRRLACRLTDLYRLHEDEHPEPHS